MAKMIQKIKKNSLLEPFWWKIMVLGILFVMSISMVSAGDLLSWDNEKIVSPDNKTITYVDNDFIGDGQTELATFELKTEHNQKVGLGYQKVFEYIITNSFDSVDKMIGETKFYNVKKDMKPVEVDLDLKYKIIKIENTTTTNCTLDNGIPNCKLIPLQREVEVWLDYTPKTILKDEVITISGWTNVRQGDKIEWVTTFYEDMFEATEWAVWEGNLSVGLFAYWKLDEQSGVVLDATGNLNNMTNSGASNTTGKIIYGYDFEDTESDYIESINGALSSQSTTELSVGCWIKAESWNTWDQPIAKMNGGTGTGTFQMGLYSPDGSPYFGVNEDGGAGKYVDCNTAMSLGEWHFLVMTYKANDYVRAYVDGTENCTAVASTSAGLNWSASFKTYIGARKYGASVQDFFDGVIDECFIYNRSISSTEVGYLWNSGDGCQYGSEACVGVLNTITSTLNSPVAYANFSDSDVVFNCTGKSSADNPLANISLIINSTYNVTNSSPANNTPVINTIPLTDGYYNWTCEVCDSTTGCDNATERTFWVDTIFPTIEINYPTTTLDWHQINTNQTINYTITDTNLDTCWIDYLSNNVTLNCTSGALNTTEINITQIDSNTARIWANDSSGNTNSSLVSWDYRLLEINNSYISSVVEGSNNYFNITFHTNGTAVTIGNLTYNNSYYIGTIESSGDNYTISKLVAAPSTSADVNVSWLWNISMQDGWYYSYASANQTILNFGIDNCSVNNETLYNFTQVNEETQVELNESAIAVNATLNLQLYAYGTDTLITNYSTAFNGVNPYAVCFSSNLSGGERYNLDLQLQYDAAGYSPEFYHIQNSTIDHSDFPINITLYDLNESNAQEFKVTFKDSDFLPVEDALVVVQRKYISEGIFKVVEIAKTDSDGITLVHLQLSDVIYTIVVQKNGEILATYADVIALCENIATGDCQIKINQIGSNIPVDDFVSVEGLTFTIDYNDTTRTITSVFSVLDGTPETINLIVTKSDNFGNQSVCNDTITTASGTLSCVVSTSFGNETIRAEILKGTDLVGFTTIQLDEEPTDIYAGSYIFVNFLILASLFFAGLSGSIVVTAIFMILALFVSVGLHLMTGNFIGSGASFLWAIVAIALIIWKATRRESQST